MTLTYCHASYRRLPEDRSNRITVASYAYNHLNQRINKTTPDSTTHYHHDAQGRLWSETDGLGNTIRDYIWMGDMPVAMVDYPEGIERVTYLHADHLNTPRYGTNQAGAVVWQWQSDAFGNGHPNEDVDGNGVSVQLNLRFPGQYYDAETGLHYNWNRYYDPSIGRYITSDPIGLEGGLNTYAYTEGNPIGLIDPMGLASYLVGRPLQAEFLNIKAGDYAGHMYVVVNADYIGDPNASIYSYGKSNASKKHGRNIVHGLMGRVDKDPHEFSKATYQSDLTHWFSLASSSCQVANMYASPIGASDDVVSQYAESLIPTVKYHLPIPFYGRLDAVNSNSAALAVANRASDTNTPLPAGPRYPGASQWNRVIFK